MCRVASHRRYSPHRQKSLLSVFWRRQVGHVLMRMPLLTGIAALRPFERAWRLASDTPGRPNAACASACTDEGSGSISWASALSCSIRCSSHSASPRAGRCGFTRGRRGGRPCLIPAGDRGLNQLRLPSRELRSLARAAGADVANVAARASRARCRGELSRHQHTLWLPRTSAARQGADTCQSRSRSRAAASSRSSAARYARYAAAR